MEEQGEGLGSGHLLGSAGVVVIKPLLLLLPPLKSAVAIAAITIVLFESSS